MSKTLEELGYEEVIDCAGIHYFKDDRAIEISEHNKGVACYNLEDWFTTEYLTIEELQAIIKKNDEHKWI